MQIPKELLDTVDEGQLEALQSASPLEAAGLMFEIIEGMPALSSHVRPRSQWLAQLSTLMQAHGEQWSETLEVRLLIAVAHTAFAARETTSAMTASERAIDRAIEIGDLGLETLARARRVAWLCPFNLEEADEDMHAAQVAWGALPEERRTAAVFAELMLAAVAWQSAHRDFEGVRRSLAGLGRAALPRDGRIHFIAYASQCALAQMSLHTRQRVQAVRSLVDAGRIAHELQAWSELANVQTALAAYAVRAGDFNAAISHAGSAVAAMEASSTHNAQPDPWLGLPFDVAPEADVAEAIRHLAESAVAAQEAEDRTGFLVSATGMVAFYLLADRGPEGLDTVNEAIEAMNEMQDEQGVAMLHDVAERLLRYMGMLA